MLSQFFILSTRGDTIIKRDCKLIQECDSGSPIRQQGFGPHDQWGVLPQG